MLDSRGDDIPQSYVIMATVVTDDASDAFRASEVFNRACMGLAMEGISTKQDMTSYYQEGIDDESSSDGEDTGPGSPGDQAET